MISLIGAPLVRRGHHGSALDVLRKRRASEQSVAPSPLIHEMDRRCADAVSGIARRTSSSGPRNQHSEVMSAGRRSAVGGPAVQQNATLKPATFEVRHEISSNFSAFCLPNAVPMQQNHSVSGSEISGCSQPYPGPPVDLRKTAN